MTDREKLDLLLQQQEEMRQQIGRIDSRLDNQEHRLNGVDIHVTRVLEMDSKLTRIENFLGDVHIFNRLLKSLDGHITNTNTILATHTAALGEIRQRLDMKDQTLN